MEGRGSGRELSAQAVPGRWRPSCADGANGADCGARRPDAPPYFYLAGTAYTALEFACMGAFEDVVMFGRACRGAHGGGEWGGIHVAIAPVPHRGQWTAECGVSLSSTDRSVSVVHGAVIMDERSTRVCWLPPGAYMEYVCYRCVRRAGATHVVGMWHEAPPPARMRRRLAPRAGASKRRRGV